MKRERGDLITFLHGIFNVIWAVFAYDIASLASLTVTGYGRMSYLPMTIMLVMPIISDAVGIVVASIRYYKRQNVLAVLGLILSVGALGLYYILRVVMQFSLGWLDPGI